MNPRQISTSSFTILYYRFRDSPIYSIALFLLFIIVALVLLWNVVIPQTQEWFSIQREIAETQAKIDVVNDNISSIQRINTTDLASNLKTALSAVPGDKDFFSIFIAIADSAVKSGAALGEFVISPGLLATASASQQGSEQPIVVIIPVMGDFDTVKNFTRELNEKLPLSSNDGLQLETGSSFEAKLRVSFDYKNVPPSTITYTEPISPLSVQELTRISQLKSWEVLLLEEFASKDATLSQPF